VMVRGPFVSFFFLFNSLSSLHTRRSLSFFLFLSSFFLFLSLSLLVALAFALCSCSLKRGFFRDDLYVCNQRSCQYEC
jgi:hypothetical protein